MKNCIIKLFYAVMLITICLCSMDAGAAMVAKGTCGDNLTWILDDTGLLTISGTGDMYDYYCDYQPEEIPWYPVRSKVFSVVLENGVTSIGNDAFYECTNLSDITISDSVKSIGYTPYEKCNNINKIYINNIEAWCNIDFSGLSSNPLYFGADLYVDGVLADDIVIPYGVVSIGEYAFSEYKRLTSITFPDTITNIGEWAFFACDNIGQVNVGSLEAWCSIRFGDEYANPLNEGADLCIDNVLIYDAVIPDNVTAIGDYAFYGCNNISSVTIHSDVTYIGEGAFGKCENIEQFAVSAGNADYCSVDGVLFDCAMTTLMQYPAKKTDTHYTIPDGVSVVEESAFYLCDNLKSIYIPDSVTVIKSDFDNLEKVYAQSLESWCNIEFEGGSVSNPASVKADLYISGALAEDIIIPDSVTKIGKYTFWGCDSITKVTIHAGVTYIDEDAFRDNSKLTEFVVAEDNPNYCSVDGVLYNKAMTILMNYPAKKQDVCYTVPDTVKTVCDGSFSRCNSLSEVIIPEGVTKIEDCFWACASLEKVSFPKTASEIYTNFIFCYKLNEISVDADNENYCSVDGVLFDKKMTRLLKYPIDKTGECYDVPESVVEIDSNAFQHCSNLKNVTLPAGLTIIYRYAFDDCSNLQSISMPASIETIYHDAFRKCCNLSEVIYDGTIDMWNDIVIDEGNECLTYAYYKTNPYASVANVSCEYDGYSANVNVEFDFVNYAFDMYAGIYNSAGELQCIQKTTVNPGESETHIAIDNPGMSFDEYSCKIMMWNKGGIMPLAKPVTVYVELTDLEQQFLNAANNAEFLEEMLQIVREWMPVHGVDEFVQLRISDQYSVCESLIEATPYDSIDKFRSMLKKQIDKYTASAGRPSSGSGSGGGGDSSTGGSSGH